MEKTKKLTSKPDTALHCQAGTMGLGFSQLFNPQSTEWKDQSKKIKPCQQMAPLDGGCSLFHWQAQGRVTEECKVLSYFIWELEHEKQTELNL